MKKPQHHCYYSETMLEYTNYCEFILVILQDDYLFCHESQIEKLFSMTQLSHTRGRPAAGEYRFYHLYDLIGLLKNTMLFNNFMGIDSIEGFERYVGCESNGVKIPEKKGSLESTKLISSILKEAESEKKALLKLLPLYEKYSEQMSCLQRSFLARKTAAGHNIFHLSLQLNTPELIRWMLPGIVNIDFITENGFKALDLAIHSRNIEILSMVLSAGANASKLNPATGRYPLHLAVSNKQLAMVKALISHQAKGDSKQSECGKTALHLSVEDSDTSITKVLLEAGVNPNIVDDDGYTALHYCIAGGQWDQFEVMVNTCGSQPGQPLDMHCVTHDDKWSCPHLAAGLPGGSPVNKILKTLKTQAVSFTEQDQGGNTPLHIAMNDYDARKVQFFIEHTDSINTVNHKGETPIFTAIRLDDVDGMQYLLDHGARLDISNHQQETPLSIARREHSSQCVALLESRLSLSKGMSQTGLRVDGHTMAL